MIGTLVVRTAYGTVYGVSSAEEAYAIIAQADDILAWKLVPEAERRRIGDERHALARASAAPAVPIMPPLIAPVAPAWWDDKEQGLGLPNASEGR